MNIDDNTFDPINKDKQFLTFVYCNYLGNITYLLPRELLFYIHKLNYNFTVEIKKDANYNHIKYKRDRFGKKRGLYKITALHIYNDDTLRMLIFHPTARLFNYTNCDNDKIRIDYKICNYKDDKREGYALSYYNKNNLCDKIEYINDKKEGLYVLMHSNGTIWKKINYKNDKKEGLYESYFGNGRPHKLAYYENDLLYGLYEEWTHYSDRRYCIYYEKGKMEGLYEVYRPGGTLQKRMYYKNNKLHGSYQEFDGDGNVTNQYYYVDGDLTFWYYSTWIFTLAVLGTIIVAPFYTQK